MRQYTEIGANVLEISILQMAIRHNVKFLEDKILFEEVWMIEARQMPDFVKIGPSIAGILWFFKMDLFGQGIPWSMNINVAKSRTWKYLKMMVVLERPLKVLELV